MDISWFRERGKNFETFSTTLDTYRKIRFLLLLSVHVVCDKVIFSVLSICHSVGKRVAD